MRHKHFIFMRGNYNKQNISTNSAKCSLCNLNKNEATIHFVCRCDVPHIMNESSTESNILTKKKYRMLISFKSFTTKMRLISVVLILPFWQSAGDPI